MLIGNPADFDRIRARYEALKYPTPEQASFNATRDSYRGLLTGSGYDTAMIPTTVPGQQVSFAVDPNTGQVTTQIPQYEVPTFETLYDAGEGLIGADGLPSAVANTSMGGGQALSATPQRGGDGRENLERFREMQARNNLRNEIAENFDKFNMLPGYEVSKLPGLLGFFDETLSNFDREIAIDRIMRDIDASKDFGVNKFGLGTSYKGSSGIDRDPADFGRPTTGPSARDTDLGKSTGGKGPSTTSGRGQDSSGRGQAGGARGGDNPGNTGGTSRF